MRQKLAKDRAVAVIAARQHGVVSTEQLLASGLSPNGISRRVRDGRLHREHRGVYAVGHAAPSFARKCMAGVLAYQRNQPKRAGHDDQMDLILDLWGATLSHLSAACLWKLLPLREGPVDISVPGSGGKAKRYGIRIHRSVTLLPADVTLRSGIPVTNAARTIADLRRVVSRQGQRGLISPRELRRAIRQAEVLGLPIDEGMAGDRTRSDLEGDFLRLCHRYGLPAPEVNVRVGRHLVDFLWRGQKLVVETDGYEYHRGRQAFVDDRARDLGLRREGFQVVRLSEEQVNREAEQVAGTLGRLLQGHTR
jgi:hypothetical protein